MNAPEGPTVGTRSYMYDPKAAHLMKAVSASRAKDEKAGEMRIATAPAPDLALSFRGHAAENGTGHHQG